MHKLCSSALDGLGAGGGSTHLASVGAGGLSDGGEVLEEVAAVFVAVLVVVHEVGWHHDLLAHHV